MSENEASQETPELDSWLELSNVNNMFFQSTTYGTSADVSIEDIYRYLMNPQAHIKQIRNASSYLTNRHGILKDVLRMVQSLPTLKYNLIWSKDGSHERGEADEKSVQDFLEGINVKQVLRDGLYEAAELGTVVACLRDKQYVQFLDLDDIVMRKQRGGKWVVEFDLKTLDGIRNMQDKVIKINSLPNEITLAEHNKYKNSNDKELDRYIEIKNCHVISVDAKRNSPHGLPMTLGGWLPILQKEIISKVERSVSGRMLNQVLTLTADWIDKDKSKPVPKPLLQAYFNEVSKLIGQKDNIKNQRSESGSGVIALPHFLKLDSVTMDTSLFKEELYNKLDDDIFMSLGISKALVSGEGGSYASANVNEIKFFSYITVLLEQFEAMLNDYIKMILPEGKSCKIILDRSTVLDKQAQIEQYKNFHLQTGIAQPYIEALFGGNTFHAMLEQAQYEKETLETEKWLKPPLNPHTMSSKDIENQKDNESTNDNTQRAKDNNGNGTPKPK